jgi:hypothetical protein
MIVQDQAQFRRLTTDEGETRLKMGAQRSSVMEDQVLLILI